jgi:hypothetical protein
MARERHGVCESNMAALCKSNGKTTIKQGDIFQSGFEFPKEKQTENDVFLSSFNCSTVNNSVVKTLFGQ